MFKFNIRSDEFYQNLQALEKRIPNVSLSVMEDVADKVEAKAKELCPVGETGNLRASIGTSVEQNSTGVSGIVYANTEYAPYVHEGIGQPAQPFLEKAVRSEGIKLINLIKKELFNE